MLIMVKTVSKREYRLLGRGASHEIVEPKNIFYKFQKTVPIYPAPFSYYMRG